jgi:hypothetical protein
MTQRDRIVLLVIASIAIVGGYWFFALKPKREEVAAAETRISEAQAKVAEADQALANARESKASYQKNYATVANLGKAVPVDDNVDTMVYQLETIARKNGVKFQSFELKGGGGAAAPTAASTPSASVTATLPPGAAVGAAGFPTMPFSFVFQGSFFTLQKFLADINSMTTVRKDGRIRVRGRMLQVDGLGLQPGPRGFPFVEAKIAATAYVLPEDQGLTAGASPSNPGDPTSPAQSTIDADGGAR